MDIDEADEADCSDEFYLMASEEAPETGDIDGPYLFVTSPASGDFAQAGEVYTVEVRERKKKKHRVPTDFFFFCWRLSDSGGMFSLGVGCEGVACVTAGWLGSLWHVGARGVGLQVVLVFGFSCARRYKYGRCGCVCAVVRDGWKDQRGRCDASVVLV